MINFFFFNVTSSSKSSKHRLCDMNRRRIILCEITTIFLERTKKKKEANIIYDHNAMSEIIGKLMA